MWLKARVPIDTHPLCICKHGHYGYVGCSDGRIIMIDLDEDLGVRSAALRAVISPSEPLCPRMRTTHTSTQCGRPY
jgi:hypothetical protein